MVTSRNIGVVLLLLLFALWGYIFTSTPIDIHQGTVYRILYVHVPVAFTAFFAAFLLFICSILGFRNQSMVHWSRACCEVGFVFTLLTLATGSIWGKPTWGTWWTWDARLTTTFILSLLYAGYLLLSSSLPQGDLQTKILSVLGILIFADVPIIYKSVTWWRTLHQPPTLMGSSGTTISPSMLWTLIASIAVIGMLAMWFIWQRKTNLQLLAQLESQSLMSALREDVVG